MPRRPLQRIQAITVARRYFIERQTKREIGKDLGISRFKVARLIDEAIEEGLVRFEIDDAGELDARLSDRLREKYSLRNALVLAGPDLPCSALFEPLGRTAASLLEEVLFDDCHLHDDLGGGDLTASDSPSWPGQYRSRYDSKRSMTVAYFSKVAGLQRPSY